MSLSRIFFLFALIFPLAYGGSISHKCQPTKKSPALASNLNTILNKFKTQFPQALFYKDQTTAPGNDNAFAIAQCKGDISIPDCKSCVATAVTEILGVCPNSKEAIIWYENCFLKFSDRNFFGNVDHTLDADLESREDVQTEHSMKIPDFLKKVQESLTTTAAVAAWSTSLYGQKSFPYSGKTIYTTAQCTKDLNGAKCYQCLVDQIGRVPKVFWEGNIGGRIFGSSCNFRFEFYPFYKS